MTSFFIEPSILQLKESIPPETYILSELDVQAKYLFLGRTPQEPEAVQVSDVYGITHVYGLDYVIIGNILAWANKKLDGYLEAGEQLIIRF
jgi:hypothetical protein